MDRSDLPATELWVRFTDLQEERDSPVYGPYTLVQLTYELLRVELADGSEGPLALLRPESPGWWCEADDRHYSDVCIGPYPPHPGELRGGVWVDTPEDRARYEATPVVPGAPPDGPRPIGPATREDDDDRSG